MSLLWLRDGSIGPSLLTHHSIHRGLLIIAESLALAVLAHSYTPVMTKSLHTLPSTMHGPSWTGLTVSVSFMPRRSWAGMPVFVATPSPAQLLRFAVHGPLRQVRASIGIAHA